MYKVISCILVLAALALILVGCEFPQSEKEEAKVLGIRIAGRTTARAVLKKYPKARQDLKMASEQILFLLQQGKQLQGIHWNLILKKLFSPELAAFAQDILTELTTYVQYKQYFSKRDMRYMVAFFSGLRLGCM